MTVHFVLILAQPSKIIFSNGKREEDIFISRKQDVQIINYCRESHRRMI